MSSPSPYPERNPFDALATSVSPDNVVDLTKPRRRPVTEKFPHVQRALGIALGYVNEYQSKRAIPDAPPGNAGGVMVLKGEHGSGKTHTIEFLIRQVAEEGKGPAPAVHLNVRVESPDFITVYRALMNQLSFTLVREVFRRSLENLAAEQWKQEASTEEARQLIAQRLESDEGAALDAFRRHLVDPDSVVQLQRETIATLNEQSDDFQNAIPFLARKNDQLANDAYLWLIGSEGLDPAALARLGVKSPIASIDACKAGLRLLASIFSLARRPLIVYLDQFERLLIGASPRQASDNRAVLRRLVDQLPKSNALLAIAGTDAGWRELATDVRARFAPGLVDLPRLTFEDTRKLVGTYVQSVPPRTADSIFPFTEEALQLLWQLTRHNMRALLQACYGVFDRAEKMSPKATIDEKFVNQAFNDTLIAAPATVAEIQAHVERLLSGGRARWDRNVAVGSLTADYAVYGSDALPLLAFQIKRSVFADDEVTDALKLVKIVEEATRAGLGLRVVLVVAGYVSSRVTESLNAAGVEQLAYESSTFETDFQRLLSMSIQERRPSSAAQDAKLLEELHSLRNDLQAVRAQREMDRDEFDKRVRAAIETNATAPTAETLTAASMLWLEERRALETQIAQARRDRRQNEFVQLRRATARVERSRLQRLLVRTYGVAALLLLVPLMFASIVKYPSSEIIFVLAIHPLFVAAGILIVATLIFALLYFRSWQATLQSVASANVDSEEELDQLSFESYDYPYTSHPNPQVRYVALRSVVLPDSLVPSVLRQLAIERISAVRRAAAVALRRHAGKILATDVPDIAEVAYIVEGVPAPRWKQVSPKAGLVAVVTWAHRSAKGYAPVFEELFPNLEHEVVLEIESAFQHNSTLRIDVVGRQNIRSALRLLSPLEDGIGTIDRLESIATIDELFFFLRRQLSIAEQIGGASIRPDSSAA